MTSKLKFALNWATFVLATCVGLAVALPLKGKIANELTSVVNTNAIASSIGMLASFIVFLVVAIVLATPSWLLCAYQRKESRDGPLRR